MINTLVLIPYFILLVAGVVIPSDGEHGILSIKSLAFVFCALGVGSYALLRGEMTLYQIKIATYFLAACTFFLGAMALSSYYGTTSWESQSDQFKLFVITLLFPLMTLYLVHEKLVQPKQIYQAVIFATFFYAFLKVTLFLLHFLHLIDLWKFLKVFNFRVMSMNIAGGVDRVQTSVDIVAPFILLFVLQSEKLGLHLNRSFKALYVVFTLLSTFLSFSRYLSFVYFASIFFYTLTLSPKGILKMLLITCLGALSLYFFIGHEQAYTAIQKRLYSSLNYTSDSIRKKQVDAMLSQIGETPCLGTGLGGFAPDCVRVRPTKHLYEVQWMAFTMQFGLIGLAILLIPLLQTLCRLLHPSRLSFLLLFSLWLFSGFTNPFLISLTSGIIYTLFYLIPNATLEKNSHPLYHTKNA